MGGILTAIAIMTGLGVFFGVALAVANRYLKVQEDPRLDILEGMLPGSNCGACGQAGCRAFAEALLGGVTKPSKCTVSSPDGVASVAAFLGVDAGREEKRVARLHCAGGLGQARQIAEYEGHGSCAAAHLVGGGGKGCSWGCLGLADCAIACDFDAIHMNDQSLPVVDVDKCTACGDCVEACPRDLFDILPLSQKLIVQCKAPLEGEAARAVCQVACDACGRCAQDAAPGLIRMVNNLPVVDYSAGGPARPEATFRCPTGAIRWVEGGQFQTAQLVHLTIGEHGE
ncbi:MAG: RnfABCDGE type electron transport complex subunit B [Phycisphaerales bacterium]|nr:RnfABCDGE type electron transport complex subunit B [Phycisphaerales bacterium]